MTKHGLFIAGNKHAENNKRIYVIWRNLKKRCYRKENKDYKYYGAKGITVCDEWLKTYLNFFLWAIDNGYKSHLTIDRINNNKGYSPENCKWSTIKEQANNKTTSIVYIYNNKKYTVPSIAKDLGMTTSAIYRRINQGWSVEEIISTPKGGKR